MRKLVSLLSVALLVLSFQSALGKNPEKAQAKRDKINANASEALAKLFENSPKAKRLYDDASGYAVFTITKVSLGVTGGGGRGVAVDKAAGLRIYMKMATGGLNLGLGGQKYHVVFLFEDGPTFDKFVNSGWQAEGSASAVAGTAGANVEASFVNGMAVFQITEAGLMLSADISGTKYWKNDKLN